MNEFELIAQYFSPLGALLPGAASDDLGIGDDAALLQPRPGRQLVVCTDTLVAGRHFDEQLTAASIGYKALAVNLSDLAAMGAQPRAFTLALTLPEFDADWLAGFAGGLQAIAEQFACRLIGGDTTRGPLSITITAIGDVASGRALLRSGARAGDQIAVSGHLGDAALALRLGAQAPELLRKRLHRPCPRIALGQLLGGRAHSCIDLSDGLVGDLGHILKASGVGARIRPDLLPASLAFLAHCDPADRLALQGAGGDDYELCFTAPAAVMTQLASAAEEPVTVIGEITESPGLTLIDADGASMAAQISDQISAFQHFE